MKKALLSFVGNQDPFGKFGDGPILSLLRNSLDYDKVILFYNQQVNDGAEKTLAAIQDINAEIEVIPCKLNNLKDPTNHEMILEALRPELNRLCPFSEDWHYEISISSGTPAMHACWFMLASSGEIFATLLHKREAGVDKGQELIRVIDPRSRSFPIIRQNIALREIPELDIQKYNEAIEYAGITGKSAKLHKELAMAARIAETDATVLIRGANGTGKELVAKFIHHLSLRSCNDCHTINCASLPENLIENELFGSEKGAFSGANPKGYAGAFREAHGGTLFLDEIGDLALTAQAKVLRALEYKEIKPLGSVSPIKVDVRIICATNRDLNAMIAENRFREDLYYRIKVVEIYLPSLDERKEDIPILAEKMMDQFNKKHNKQSILTHDALNYLKTRNWPGNIRDLMHLIERSVIFSTGNGEISAAFLHKYNPVETDRNKQALFTPDFSDGFILDDYMNDLRTRIYYKAMAMAENNQSQAAKLLGVSPQAVSKFLKP